MRSHRNPKKDIRTAMKESQPYAKAELGITSRATDADSHSLFQEFLDVPHGDQRRRARTQYDNVLLHLSLLLDPLPLFPLAIAFHSHSHSLASCLIWVTAGIIITRLGPIHSLSEGFYPFFVDVRAEGREVGFFTGGEMSEGVVDVCRGFLCYRLDLTSRAEQ